MFSVKGTAEQLSSVKKKKKTKEILSFIVHNYQKENEQKMSYPAIVNNFRWGEYSQMSRHLKVHKNIMCILNVKGQLFKKKKIIIYSRLNENQLGCSSDAEFAVICRRWRRFFLCSVAGLIDEREEAAGRRLLTGGCWQEAASSLFALMLIRAVALAWRIARPLYLQTWRVQPWCACGGHHSHSWIRADLHTKRLGRIN